MDLSIHFIDLYNTIYTVQLYRDLFLDECWNKGVTYFIKELANSNTNELTLFVPYAEAMGDIVEFITSGAMSVNTDARRIMERVFCLDYMELDPMDEFTKLFDIDVGMESYELVHQFASSKSFDKIEYVELLIAKLPMNYPYLNDIPQHILAQILTPVKRNLMITRSKDTVLICDNNSYQVLNTFASIRYNVKEKIKSIAINKTQPLIVIAYEYTCVMYNILSGKIECYITGRLTTSKITSICFSPNGRILYVSAPGEIEVFDLDTLCITRRFSYDCNASAMICIDNDVLVFVDKAVDFFNANICVFNLNTKTIKYIDRTNTSRIYFTGKSLIYESSTDGYIGMYDIINHKALLFDHCCYNSISDVRNVLHRTNVLDKIIHHPTKNIIACFFPYHGSGIHSPSVKNYGVKIFRDGILISNLLIEANSNIKNNHFCFSHDGKYIYAMMKKRYPGLFRIDIYSFLEEGLVTFVQTVKIDNRVFRDQALIANVLYR